MGLNAITENLINRMNDSYKELMGIDIVVSFIRYSGLKQILPLLEEAKQNGIPVRILTSTYMDITEPIALSELYRLLGDDCIRLYNGRAPSFHPKAYFFKHQEDKNSYVLVGSSNISRVALTNGIEWNYQVNRSDDEKAYKYYLAQFEYLYKHDSYAISDEVIKRYQATKSVSEEERVYKRVNQHFDAYRKRTGTEKEPITDLYEPNIPQLEALFELNKTREEGNQRALVVVATGVGKTFLAAFDSKAYATVLFVAHREEILKQAYDTFSKIRGSEALGRFYKDYRECDSDVVFASVQTLSKQANLKRLNPDRFDYVVIDEFHHASAPSYKRVVDYFKPEFLLGLTATPHRLDKKDVFGICDYNVPYTVTLFNAISRDWLVPFQYYGIYDSTVNYDNVTYLKGGYVEDELRRELSTSQRSELVIKHYNKHRRKSALGFCVNIDHAEYMASEFIKNGIKAAAVHSQGNRENAVERGQALHQLSNGELDIIFAVDMLNEGVDIPGIDLLLFLRPTESPTVFLQQLGRGLRHSKGKENLRVLDFIGNYRKVDLLPLWLSDKTAVSRKEKASIIRDLNQQKGLPQGCFVDFDLEVVDLFHKMIASQQKIQDRIQELYHECKDVTGHIPTRVELFEYLDDVSYKNILKAGKQKNPFKNYVAYVSQLEGDYVPTDYFDSDAQRFINMIETTSMQTLYKIAVFKAFLNKGAFKMTVTKEEICESFYEFYQNKRHWSDLKRYKTRKDFREWNASEYWTMARENPINFLKKTENDVFAFDERTDEMSIVLNLEKWKGESFFIQQVEDAIRFRRNEFVDKKLG